MAHDLNSKIKEILSGEKEISMEIRLLLAFALMGLVLFGTQFLMPKPPQKPVDQKAQVAAPQAQPASAQPAESPKPQAPATAAPAKAVAAKAAPAKSGDEKPAAVAVVAAEKEETHVVDTDVYRIVFSNRGAAIRSWILKKYKDGQGKPVELVDSRAGLAFSYFSPVPAAEFNKALFVVKQDGPFAVDFLYSDGVSSARKTFKFEKAAYRGTFSSELSVGGKPQAHKLAWRGGFGDRTVHNALDVQHSVYFDGAKSKLVTASAKDASKGPISATPDFHFAGMEDTYFAGVILPEAGTGVEFITVHDMFAAAQGEEAKEHVGVAFGGKDTFQSVLFVGPKDTDILRDTNRKLESMIDWGWFWFIAKPLFLSLHWINDKLTASWGWAIVLATVIINLLMLPLRFSQLRSSQKMAAIQPELQAIQARYKNIPMKDPRKQKQNEEMMALYQKHGINPMGGCVPLLLQMPFFIAFFKVLSVAIELRGAQWLWVTDLSQPETTLIRFLPVGMLVTQVLMQKMTPAASPDPSQQRLMMIMMPIMLTVMFYGASSGLVLYWLTGNVVGIVQQYFFNQAATKRSPAQAATSKKK
ncbi:MAG: membrane protein insertase YidC [Acidobacteria bacterium]|nr:membrane protein insertase YidC [Acidobacteriota bacterium]